MSTLNEFKRIVLSHDKYEKVSGGIQELVNMVKSLSHNELYRAEPLKGLLLDQEFMLDVYSEAKGLDTEARDTIVRSNPPKPNVSPYIHYDIYLTEQSFIKNLPESSDEFYDRDDYDFDQLPYPFQYCIFEGGKNRMNELYKLYKEDSYSDLKAIQKDLKEDLEKHNLRFYLEILASLKKTMSSSDEPTVDPVETLSSILFWVYGGSGLGLDYMYLFESYFINIRPAADNYLSYSIDRYNSYRLHGAKIYFRIYLIDHLLKMKKLKFAGDRVGLNYFLEDYKKVKEGTTENLLRQQIVGIKPDKDELYLFYSRIRFKGKKDAFYEMEGLIEELNFDVKEYYRTDTPENFDKSFTNWQKKKMKEDPEFLNKRSQLHDFWKLTSR